jgi:hypothetical protein
MTKKPWPSPKRRCVHPGLKTSVIGSMVEFLLQNQVTSALSMQHQVIPDCGRGERAVEPCVTFAAAMRSGDHSLKPSRMNRYELLPALSIQSRAALDAKSSICSTKSLAPSVCSTKSLAPSYAAPAH